MGRPPRRRDEPDDGALAADLRPLPLVWSAPLLLTSAGYGEEARAAILGLRALRVDVRADPVEFHPWHVALASGAAEEIEYVLATDLPDRFHHVVHAIPSQLRRHPAAERAVARTMYETDRLPTEWVSRCNTFDEVWVPSEFNMESFARAGVAREKLVKIPESLRAELYESPGRPLPLEGATGFVFLCVSTWNRRKGWDVLAQAYVEEFSATEDVTLVFAVPPESSAQARSQLRTFLRDTLDRDLADAPRILVRPVALADVDVPRLYRAAGAYVMASRGEGWGRPYMEAMACGVPTIGTRWGGNLEFMDDDNAFLIDCRLVDVEPAAWGELDRFSGHRWAEPSVDHLRELLRRVCADRRQARARAKKGRAEVLDRLRADRVARTVVERLEATRSAAVGRSPRPPRRVGVVWEGEQFGPSGGAIRNREMCRALMATGRVQLSLHCDLPANDSGSAWALAAQAVRDAKGPPAVHVRGSCPSVDSPPAGRLVLWQPRGMGRLPAEWVQAINAVVDELWVASRHERERCVRRGLDPERVAVVPQGVNPLRFHPAVPPMWLPTRKRVRLLFLGRAVPDRGIDLAVRSYLDAFGPDDDVCLVVKDTHAGPTGRSSRIRDELLGLQDEGGIAEVRYLDAPMSPDGVARLYAACHCLVAPFRTGASPMSPAEAMACGVPAILPAVGGHLEYCDAEMAYFVGTSGNDGDVDPDALARAMRHVYEHPDEAHRRGRHASAVVRRRSSWARVADTAVARLQRLAGRSPARSSTRAGVAPLTACVIARDEEAHIGACVRSVRGLAAQTVVVDTGSTDATARIARSRGAEVYAAQWTDDFAAARNESLRHARHPWTLVLDADETLDSGSHDQIRRLLSGPPVGYLLRMRNYTEAEGRAEWVEHLNLRLFPNDPRLAYASRDPHSRLTPVTAVDLDVQACEAVIHHEGYRPQVFDGRSKALRNLAALEVAVRERPHDPFDAFNLGRTYGQLGRDSEAERMLARAIELGRPPPGAPYPPYLLSAHLSLALALLRQGRHRESALWSERAVELAPHFADAHVTLAAARASLGDLDGALEAYQGALGCAGGPVTVATERASSGWKALLGMAEIHLVRGATGEALDCVARAEALAPGHPAVAELLERARRADQGG